MKDLFHGKTVGLGVIFKSVLDHHINPYETLREVNSFIWGNFITQKMKEIDHIWISEYVSFYKTLPSLIS